MIIKLEGKQLYLKKL